MAISIKFDNNIQKEFTATLMSRVNKYFKENSLSKYGGNSLIFKSLILTFVYIGAYVLIMSGVLNIYIMWLFTAILGVAAAGIGMAFMHDANHGSFSKSKKINQLMGLSMEMIGASSTTWKIKHNILHHTYTNIENVDEDIASRPLYRFTKGAKLYKFHRFQQFYMFFLYGLMTLVWAVIGDFTQLNRFHKQGLLGKNKTFGMELFKLIISKIFYYSYAIILPLVFLDITWWQFLIGFFTVQFIFGFILSVTFQMAHMVEKAEFPEPQNNIISQNWFVHQLQTTADFAQKNKILTWYIGGLNFQVEHHLFPRISHIHYPAISKIVKQTTKEFDITYNVYDNFFQALKSHFKMLKKMGRTPELA